MNGKLSPIWAIPMGRVLTILSIIIVNVTGVVAQEFDSDLFFPCATCHGVKGEGVPAKNGPMVAGLAADYVESELLAFANGTRGAHPTDRHGGEMALVAKAYTPDDLAKLADIVAALDAPEIVPSGASSAQFARGRDLYQQCVSCHGAYGEGDAGLNSPRLAGQNAQYLARQIEHYLTGVRGGASDDPNGQAMAAFLKSTLTNPSDATEIANYLAALSAVSGENAASQH